MDYEAIGVGEGRVVAGGRAARDLVAIGADAAAPAGHKAFCMVRVPAEALRVVAASTFQQNAGRPPPFYPLDAPNHDDGAVVGFHARASQTPAVQRKV